MAVSADDSLIHLVHTIWSGALSLLIVVLGWFMRWNWTRLVSELDEKADKEALETVRQDIDRRHDEHLAALKRIEDAIIRNDDQATTVRNSLQTTMTTLVSQVAKIEGFMSGLQTTSMPPGGK